MLTASLYLYNNLLLREAIIFIGLGIKLGIIVKLESALFIALINIYVIIRCNGGMERRIQLFWAILPEMFLYINSNCISLR